MFFPWWEFLNFVAEMQPWLSLNTLQKTSGFGRCTSKINDTSFISSVKGTMLRIACFNAIYYSSVVIKAISVCNLLHHITGNPTYIITYPIRDMAFSASLAST